LGITYSVNIDTNNSNPTSNTLLLRFGEVNMFGCDESANIPECETSAYRASKEKLSAAEAIDEEEERDNRGHGLDYCKHPYIFNQHTHLTKTSITSPSSPKHHS
jgi:hypothetical protein